MMIRAADIRSEEVNKNSVCGCFLKDFAVGYTKIESHFYKN